jgi:uncharacterized metal-binding protein
LVFACSGAADVGALADQAARKITENGVAKMFCLAGVGGRVEGIVKTTEAADALLAIDGCPLDCAKKTLEQAGFTDFKHCRVTDMGFAKGLTEVSDENINNVTVAATVAAGFLCR